MRPSGWNFATFAVVVAALIVACGARTGLLPSEGRADADASTDAGFDAPIDAPDGCVPTCSPTDPSHIYACGAQVAQCDVLEQCEVRTGQAVCVNPCRDTLGNDTSNGCEFYALEVDTAPEVEGVCYAVFIVNQWKSGQPAQIKVTRGTTDLDVEQFARIPAGKGSSIAYQPYVAKDGLAQNQIAILFLSRDPTAVSDPVAIDPRALANCPVGVTPAFTQDASLHGTGTGTAFHITTNVPVVAYQMLPYGGGSARVTGATLLVPTNAWDTNYVVADAYQAPPTIPEARAGPVTVVVASVDDTMVTIKPTNDIVAGGGLAGTRSGVPVTYQLDAGQYLQFTQPNELTGSAIVATNPIGVIGASTLMDVPVPADLTMPIVRADSGEQMLPPVRALGSEYVAARYRSRSTTEEESVPWRLVGVVDGTVLTYEPAPPPGAPMVLNAQQLAEFMDPGPFVVHSQDAEHPFYLASYMTGGSNFNGRGDPDFVNVVPPAQYLPRYTFFTDPTYPETNLVIVRARDPMTGEMPEINLDCAGVLGSWQDVGTSGVYQMTRVDLSTGMFQGVGGCDNGVHTISGTLPGIDPNSLPSAQFGVTVWGWGNEVTYPFDQTEADEANPLFTRWVSYGYPAGANFKPLNSTVLPAN